MIFKMIKRYFLKPNINKEISPHSLRHSFATHLVEEIANLRAITRDSGHSVLQQLKYIHI